MKVRWPVQDKELKELAQFGARFLGMESEAHAGDYHWPTALVNSINYFEWNDHPDSNKLDFVFFEDGFSSILAHLAKRKMERDLWEYSLSYNLHGFGSHNGICGDYTFNILTAPNCKTFKSTHKKEYIALWMAIREAVKDEDK